MTVGVLREEGLADVGVPGSTDVVLTFRNIHNWIADGHFDAAPRTFHVALKPGGVLGIEEHRAAPGTPLERIIASGYAPESYAVENARAAGLELVARSEVNGAGNAKRWAKPSTNAGQEPRLCDGEEADLVCSLHAAAACGIPS